jgi:hypothetical protein
MLKEKEVPQLPLQKKTHAKGGEETKKTYLSLKKKKMVASKIGHFETLGTGESKPTLLVMALSVMK